MAGMGPPPKPGAARGQRGLSQPLMSLPAEGRTGEPPAWPLASSGEGELALWADLWTRPQAVAWERIGAERVVARYCRLLALAERSNAVSVRGLLGETRQLEDRLGLTPMAMLRLRWQIAPDEVGAKRDEHAETSAAVRKRLRAVDAG